MKRIELRSGKVVNINVMDDPINPREESDCYLGKMLCFHNGYNLGDKHNLRSSDFDSWDEVKKYLIKELDACVILPLYLYDHSGITMNTTGFNCRWDSGQVGFIYATKKVVREMFGIKRVTKSVLSKVEESLLAEVKEYDQYLTGDVYSFSIEENGKEIDSCCGFFGDNFKENGLVGYLDLNEEEIKEVEMAL